MNADFKGYRIPVAAKPIIRKIFAQDGPTILDRASVADEFRDVSMEPWLTDFELHDVPSIDCPLRVKDQDIGCLSVDSLGESEIEYSRDDLETLGVLASLSAQALANSLAYEQEARANASLRSVLKDAPDAVITTDLHGVITFASPSTERVTGYPGDEMLGHLAEEYYTGATGSPEVGHELAVEIMREVRSKGTVSNLPVHLVARQGSPRSLTLSVSLLHDPTGRDIGTLGFLKELTLLEAQGRKYRDLLEGFGYGSMQLSNDGKVGYFNRKAARLASSTSTRAEFRSKTAIPVMGPASGSSCHAPTYTIQAHRPPGPEKEISDHGPTESLYPAGRRRGRLSTRHRPALRTAGDACTTRRRRGRSAGGVRQKPR